MHTIKELRELIKAHKKKECPPLAGMKKADMMAYAKKVGALAADHDAKPVAAAAVEAPKMSGAAAYRQFIKEHTTGGKMTMTEAAAKYRELRDAGKLPKPKGIGSFMTMKNMPAKKAAPVEEKKVAMAEVEEKIEVSVGKKKAPRVKKEKKEAMTEVVAEKKKTEIEPKFPKLDVKDQKAYNKAFSEWSNSKEQSYRMMSKDRPNRKQIYLIFESAHGVLPKALPKAERDAEIKKALQDRIKYIKATDYSMLIPSQKTAYHQVIDFIVKHNPKFKIPAEAMDGYAEWKKEQSGETLSYMTKDELVSAIVNSGCPKLKGLNLDKMSKDEIVTHLIEAECDELHALM